MEATSIATGRLMADLQQPHGLAAKSHSKNMTIGVWEGVVVIAE